MKKITLLLITMLLSTYGFSQTPLTAGDIAFLGSNADGNENVTFVLLKDIDAATSIIFTDRGWSDAIGFTNAPGDGDLTWTSGIARSAGDIVELNMENTLSNTAAYAIQGDQLFAIQGSIGSPIFIAGLHYNVEPTGGSNPTITNDSNWDGTSVNNDESELPNALINGVTAIRLYRANGEEGDNFQFSCALAGGGPVTGTAAQIRAIVNDISNWNIDQSNSTAFVPPVESGCSFVIGVAADTTPPVITCAPTPGPITASVNGMAPIPNLVSGSSATDDTTPSGNIVITQSPTIGTMVGVGVTTVTVTATDAAGNFASCNINLTVNDPPSTTLTAGDIAFVGFNLDGGDGFAFVLLKDIIAGTNIKITDCGVNNPNTINCTGGDSTNTWFAPSAMSAGSIVTLNGSFFPTEPASQGDQLLAFQGTVASPIFIAAIHSNIEAGITNNTDWDGGAANNDESALPDQLINGDTAIRLHASETEIDNWQFNCALVTGGSPISGSPANIRAIINDIQYWINNDNVEFNPAANAGCSYNVINSSDATPPVISNCGSTPATIIANNNGEALVPNLTGGVTATDETTAQANLTITQSPAAGTTITAGVTTVTLFVSDEAGNTSTCTINVTVQNPPSTMLSAGDIAFVGINGDGTDSFAFILLQNIIAGTNITFTDCGINNPNTIACVGVNDGTAIWFSNTARSAGDIVTLPGSFLGEISFLGDQIFAYQGSAANPTFLAGIHTSVVVGVTNDADWDSANSDGFTTALPDQLTNGINAVRLYATGPPEAEVDNWQFDCSLVPGGLPVSGIPEEMVVIINNRQYWISNNDTEFIPAAKSGCTYNVILNLPPTALCQDVTIQLDSAGNASVTAAQVDNGSSDPEGAVALSLDITDFDCSNIGGNIVILTVTDSDGATATCTATITVEDNITPLLSCNININQPNDLGECGAIITYAEPTFSDNCDTAAPAIITGFVTLGDFQGKRFYVSTNIYTGPNAHNDAIANGGFTATIDNVEENQFIAAAVNNAGYGSVFIGYNDVAVEGSFVWQSGSTSTYTNWNPGEPNDVGGEDYTEIQGSGRWNDLPSNIGRNYILEIPIGEVTQIAGLPSGSLFPIGTTTNTFEFTDTNGNSYMCSFDVTITNSTIPIANCQDILADLDENGVFILAPTTINNGSIVGCSPAYLGLETTAFKVETDISNSDDLNGTNYYVNSSQLIVQTPGNYIFTATNSNSPANTVFILYDQEVIPNSGNFDARPGYLGFIIYDQNGTFSNGDGIGVNGFFPLDALTTYHLLTFDFNPETNLNTTVAVNNPVINTNEKELRCSNVGLNTETLYVFDAFGNISSCSSNVTVSGTLREYTASGWVNGDEPDLSSNVLINADYDSAVEGSIEGCACTVDNNATLSIKADTYLRTSGDIAVNTGASLIVAHQGSVVQDNDDAVVTNNGTIEVTVTSTVLDARDFMLLGSPMTNERPMTVESTNPLVTREFFRFLNHTTANFTPNNEVQMQFTDGTNFVDEEGDDFTAFIGPMNPTEGFYVMPQPSINQGGEQYDMLFTQTGAEGTLNTGTLTYPLGFNGTKNGSPNIMANPYPSAISAAAFITANDAVDEIYLWEHNTEPDASFPGWNSANFNMQDISSFNGVGFNPAATGTAGAGTLVNDFPISTGQGFGIKNNGALTGTAQMATFTNAMRLLDNNTTLRTPDTTKDRIWLKVKNTQYQQGSTTLVGFISNGTQAFEAMYDSPRVGTPVSIYSHLVDGTEQLGIQGREAFYEDLQVGIGFSTQIAQDNGQYSISIANLDGNLIGNATVYLKDTFMNTVQNISEAPYMFNSPMGTFNNRFVLQFVDEGILGTQQPSLSSIQIYPNPTDGVVNIYSPTTNIEAISVTDMLGRTILESQNINANQTTVDLSEKASSIYFITIKTAAGNLVKRVVKE